jgi:hypothetical protein
MQRDLLKSGFREMEAPVWHGKEVYLTHEREIFGTDPWAYGLKQNYQVIEKFLSYCYEQGISQMQIRPAELFHHTT